METLRKRLDKVLEFICCTLLALMTILVTWQVVSRYVLNNPSTVTEELVLFSFPLPLEQRLLYSILFSLKL